MHAIRIEMAPTTAASLGGIAGARRDRCPVRFGDPAVITAKSDPKVKTRLTETAENSPESLAGMYWGSYALERPSARSIGIPDPPDVPRLWRAKNASGTVELVDGMSMARGND